MATGTAPPPITETAGTPPDSMRNAARAAGVLYLITFISIPTVALYAGIRQSGYITGGGPDTGALVGGILELVMGLACIGTAVALYPVVKRQHQVLAAGFVGTRILEAATIFLGVAALWTVVELRRQGIGVEGELIGETLVAFYDRVFFVGQSLIPAVNALLLGTLMYRSGLVPRILPVLGFVGAAALVSYNFATLFGFQGDTATALALVAVLPIATWEFGLGVYLVARGFRPAAVARLDTVVATPGAPWPGRLSSQVTS